MARTPRARDKGSATIYAALLAGLLTTLTGAALTLGAAILARHRAGAAADLAALSAAAHTDTGEAPCDWARRVATAHRARLLTCACNGPVCLVSATVGTPWGAATVTSRAGPADDPAGLNDVGIERRQARPDATGLGVTRFTPLAGSVALGTIEATLRGRDAEPSPTTPCLPPRTAPLIPSTPPLAVRFRLRLAEPEPLARAPAPPLRQLRAALAGAMYPDAEQPQSDHEDPAQYRAGHEDLRGGRLDPDAQEGQVVALRCWRRPRRWRS